MVKLWKVAHVKLKTCSRSGSNSTKCLLNILKKKSKTGQMNIKSVGFRGFAGTGKKREKKLVQSALHAFNKLGILPCSCACKNSGRKITLFCFRARNFLSLHTRQRVMHISSRICIFAL